MLCDRNLEIWVMVINALAFSTLTALHLFGTYVVYKTRNSFHPYFVMFFLPFIFLYAVCDVLPISYDIAKRMGFPDDHPLQIYTGHLLTVSYRSITPIVIGFLLERLYATLNHLTYENARPVFFPLILPFGVLLATFDDLLMFYKYLAINVEQYSLLGLEFSILLLLWVLYLVNRKLIEQNTGRGVQLTGRYQLNENVRVLRLVMLVVIIDGLVTINNILAQVIFGVSSSFSMDDCERRPIYFPAFVGMLSLSLIMAGTVTLAIVYGHPANTRAARKVFRFRGPAVGSVLKPPFLENQTIYSVTRITNALGGDIIFSNSAHDYFDGLQHQWA